MTEILTGFVDSRTAVKEVLERFEEIQWFGRRLGQPRTLRRMLKQFVQQGRSERRGEEVHTALRGAVRPLNESWRTEKPLQEFQHPRGSVKYVELLREVRTTLADCFSILLLLDACLALQPPHILHDLIDIRRSDGVDLRHVAELPMVRIDAVGRRPLEGLVSVMVRFVDLMH